MAVCRAVAADVGDGSEIPSEFCVKTAKQRARDGEFPMDPGKKAVYSSYMLIDVTVNPGGTSKLLPASNRQVKKLTMSGNNTYTSVALK